MRLSEAQKLIDKYHDRQGYRVHFELRQHHILETDYFPNDIDEPLFLSADDAWVMAEQFARATNSNYVNIFVVDAHYQPVSDYRERILRPYPEPEAKKSKKDPSEHGSAGC